MVTRKPSIFEVNLIYLVLGFALLFIGYLVQTREIYSGLLITEYILILLPNIIYLKLRGYSLKDVFKLNPVSLKDLFIVILAMIFAYPVAIFLNAVFLAIINNFTSAMPTSVPIPTTSIEYFISMFIIAISPGICEEVMFRGTMFSSYEKIGHKKAIIITGVLFGIFHFNILNFVGPTFLGIILGIIVYKTNSLYSSILGHAMNNGIALTIGYFITKYSKEIDELANNTSVLTNGYEVVMSIIIIGVIAFISSIILIILLRRLPMHDHIEQDYNITELNFSKDNYGVIKYLPIFVIVLAFMLLNYKMLFHV
jgi:membrane protease YdiL (CAAX protease family)